MAEMDPILGLNDAKSIEDLQKLGSVPCQDPLLLLQVSQMFLKTAKESELNGDQEKAYVCAHHMFPQILNFQFVVTFREKKKRYSAKLNIHNKNSQGVLRLIQLLCVANF